MQLAADSTKALLCIAGVVTMANIWFSSRCRKYVDCLKNYECSCLLGLFFTRGLYVTKTSLDVMLSSISTSFDTNIEWLQCTRCVYDAFKTPISKWRRHSSKDNKENEVSVWLEDWHCFFVCRSKDCSIFLLAPYVFFFHRQALFWNRTWLG